MLNRYVIYFFEFFGYYVYKSDGADWIEKLDTKKEKRIWEIVKRV